MYFLLVLWASWCLCLCVCVFSEEMYWLYVMWPALCGAGRNETQSLPLVGWSSRRGVASFPSPFQGLLVFFFLFYGAVRMVPVNPKRGGVWTVSTFPEYEVLGDIFPIMLWYNSQSTVGGTEALGAVKPLTQGHTAPKWKGYCAALLLRNPYMLQPCWVGVGHPCLQGRGGELMTAGLREGWCCMGGSETWSLEVEGSGLEHQLSYFCEWQMLSANKGCWSH